LLSVTAFSDCAAEKIEISQIVLFLFRISTCGEQDLLETYAISDICVVFTARDLVVPIDLTSQTGSLFHLTVIAFGKRLQKSSLRELLL
jgi:hypothetical protein